MWSRSQSRASTRQPGNTQCRSRRMTCSRISGGGSWVSQARCALRSSTGRTVNPPTPLVPADPAGPAGGTAAGGRATGTDTDTGTTGAVEPGGEQVQGDRAELLDPGAA